LAPALLVSLVILAAVSECAVSSMPGELTVPIHGTSTGGLAAGYPLGPEPLHSAAADQALTVAAKGIISFTWHG